MLSAWISSSYPWVFILASYPWVAWALPQGAPCEAISLTNPENAPRHLNNTAQVGHGPYTIDVYDEDNRIRDGLLTVGRDYYVVIHGGPKGFLVRALNHEHFFRSQFQVLTDVGDFSTEDNSCAQKVDCREDGVFVTHTKNRCSKGSYIRIKYRPPIPGTDVIFRMNAVQDFKTFYNDIRTEKYTVIENPSEPIRLSSFSLAKPFKIPDDILATLAETVLETTNSDPKCKETLDVEVPFKFPEVKSAPQPVRNNENHRSAQTVVTIKNDQQKPENGPLISNAAEILPNSNNNNNNNNNNNSEGGQVNGHKLPGLASRPSFGGFGSTNIENVHTEFERIKHPESQQVNFLTSGSSSLYPAPAPVLPRQESRYQPTVNAVPISPSTQQSSGTGYRTDPRQTSSVNQNQGNSAYRPQDSNRVTPSNNQYPAKSAVNRNQDNSAYKPQNPNTVTPGNNRYPAPSAVNRNQGNSAYRASESRREASRNNQYPSLSAGVSTAAAQCNDGRPDEFPVFCGRMRQMDATACDPSKAMALRCMTTCCPVMKFMDQQRSRGAPADPSLYHQRR